MRYSNTRVQAKITTSRIGPHEWHVQNDQKIPFSFDIFRSQYDDLNQMWNRKTKYCHFWHQFCGWPKCMNHPLVHVTYVRDQGQPGILTSGWFRTVITLMRVTELADRKAIIHCGSWRNLTITTSYPSMCGHSLCLLSSIIVMVCRELSYFVHFCHSWSLVWPRRKCFRVWQADVCRALKNTMTVSVVINTNVRSVVGRMTDLQ